MKIDVSDLLKDLGAVLKVSETENISLAGDDVELTSPVTAKLKLVNTGFNVLVTGTLKTSVKLNCCRCLKDFEYPVNVSIEEEYGKPSAAKESEEEGEEGVELDEKDFIFPIDENNIIDLDEAIRQNIIVSLPIKAVCSKTCKVCQPRTEEKKKGVDPRLEKLKTLKIGGK